MMRKFIFLQGIIEDTFIFEGFDMIDRHVANGERTLRARWTADSDDVLNEYHAIDAEDELTRMLSQEFADEIDREIIRTITRDWNGGQRA